jgi:hypothetical protein
MKRILAGSLVVASTAIVLGATPALAQTFNPKSACQGYPAGTVVSLSATPTAIKINYGTSIKPVAQMSARTTTIKIVKGKKVKTSVAVPCVGYTTNFHGGGFSLAADKTGGAGTAHYTLPKLTKSFNFYFTEANAKSRLTSNTGKVTVKPKPKPPVKKHKSV